jgi:cysteine-rich repeat protein
MNKMDSAFLRRIWLPFSILGLLSAACSDGGTTSGTGGGTTSSTTTTGTGGGEAVCGDGFIQTGEECDNGVENADVAACTSKCKKATCGDSLVQLDVEDCDEGSKNSDTGACTTKCKSATCGDGFVQMGEECDDGAKNGNTAACTAKCKAATCGDGLVEASKEECDLGVKNADTGACTSTCQSAACGDGLVQMGVEECDLGLMNADTGACTTLCKNAACGDGFVQAGEDCDDGAQNGDTAACTSACKNASCGDGLVQMGVEQCDLGMMNSDTGLCTTACKNEVCGDGLVGPNEQCDLGPLNANGGACTLACKLSSCGDGFLQAGETCDLGMNNANTGACTLACQPAACGDGFIHAGVEQCDLGAANANDGACTVSCKNAVCGDGFVQTGIEECDLGGSNSNAGVCTLACKNAVCGDGFVGPGEFCDDGNQTNNDMCNTSCKQPASVLWSQDYNGLTGGNEITNGVTTDAAGSVYTIGTVPVPGRGLDIVVRRYEPDGTLGWSSVYNDVDNLDDEGFGIARAPGGVILTIGYETVPNAGKNIWVRAYTTEGGINWTRKIGGALGLDDIGYGIAANAAGEIFYTASVQIVPNQGKDIYVAKISGFDGSPIWSSQANGSGNTDDEGQGIAVDPNGFVVATGFVRTATSMDTWVRKLSDTGVVQWTKIYNGAGNSTDFGSSIATDPAGNIVVAGAETITNQGLNGWVRKYDSAGNPIWTQSFDGALHLDDVARGVAIDASGNILVGGTTTVAGATTDAWVRRYSSAGATVWTSFFNGIAGGNDGCRSVTFDSNSEIYVAGFEQVGGGEGQDGWLRRYAP